MTDLPTGWIKAPLETVAKVQLGRQRSPKNHLGPYMRPYLRAANITWNGIVLTDVKEMNFSPTEAETFLLRPGDILLSEASGSASEVGKPVLWRGEIDECYFQNTLLRVRATSADPSYLFWFFKFLALSGRFARGSRGVGIYHLGAKGLRNWNVPVAPHGDQKKIVAAIEEQFSRLDAGVMSLKKAQQKLKKLEDLLPLQLLGHHVGSESQWQSLGDVSAQVVDCPHSTPIFSPQGMPCIDTTCILPGRIRFDRLRYVDPDIYADRVRRLAPRSGDIVMAREGTVGTAVVIPSNLNPCLGQRVMLFRPADSKVRGDFLCLMINSEIVKRQYRGKLLGSTVPHLNVRDAKALRVPVPELSVQEKVAVRADEIMSGLETIRPTIATSSKRTLLQSSILEAAFSGELI